MPSAQLGSANPQHNVPPQEETVGQAGTNFESAPMNEDEDEIHLEVRRKPRGVDRPVEVTEHEEEDVVDDDNCTPPMTSEVPLLATPSEPSAGALAPYVPTTAPMQLDERSGIKRPREEREEDELNLTPTLPRLTAPLNFQHGFTSMTLVCTTWRTTLASLADLRTSDGRVVVRRSALTAGSNWQLITNQGMSAPAPTADSSVALVGSSCPVISEPDPWGPEGDTLPQPRSGLVSGLGEILAETPSPNRRSCAARN